MAVRLVGSKLTELLPRLLVKGVPPLAKKTTVPMVQESSAFGCPPRAMNQLYDVPRANATYSSSSKGQAGSASISGRRNFSSCLATENTRMNSSNPGNQKPPGADGGCDCSCHDTQELIYRVDSFLFWISTACFGFTVYNYVDMHRERKKWFEYLDSISKPLDN